MSIARAHRIIAISEFTKKEICSLFPRLKTPIEVVHIGVDEGYSPEAAPGERQHLVARFHLERPYVLVVGTLEPRKNVTAVLRAVMLLRDQSEMNLQVVLAGSQGWLPDDLAPVLQEMRQAGLVTVLGYVSKAELAALYRHAQALVYPSFYEGFGMPITEAFACGCPVITSCHSGCAEVAGDAALCVAPDDIRGLAHAIRQVCVNQKLAQQLRSLGLERAPSFSWELAMSRIHEIYREELHRS